MNYKKFGFPKFALNIIENDENLFFEFSNFNIQNSIIYEKKFSIVDSRKAFFKLFKEEISLLFYSIQRHDK